MTYSRLSRLFPTSLEPVKGLPKPPKRLKDRPTRFKVAKASQPTWLVTGLRDRPTGQPAKKPISLRGW